MLQLIISALRNMCNALDVDFIRVCKKISSINIILALNQYKIIRYIRIIFLIIIFRKGANYMSVGRNKDNVNLLFNLLFRSCLNWHVNRKKEKTKNGKL